MTFANFLREIKLMSSISHPNVLNFIGTEEIVVEMLNGFKQKKNLGVCMKDDVLWSCSELMDTDLTSVLPQLTLEARVQIAKDIAGGFFV
jgi:serine/threonine protein kinase